MAAPNVLVILVDQLRAPTGYEGDALTAWVEDRCASRQRLRSQGVSLRRHYPMSAACAPSRASLLTGQYPSLHGVSQTDGVAKTPEAPDMFWLEADTVPTLGHWFRAAGYRTFYKGKWHVTHAHLDDEDGNHLLCVDDDGVPQPENIRRYLEADLLDDWGFSEWVGPETHGLERHSQGRVRDPFTADETIELLGRLEREGDTPWLTVCSFLNPHDVAYFGVLGALKSGHRYFGSDVPEVPQAPTRHEDLTTKPSCQQSMVDLWPRVAAPQPFVQHHLKYYYAMQAEVDRHICRVLDALAQSAAAENTIVVFSSDHGDLLGAHGGMHQKWHNAYEEALHVPFVVSGPGIAPGALDTPTSHADLIPTLLGLAGLEEEPLLEELRTSHREAHPLAGRDLSDAIRGAAATPAAEPVLFMTDDEISDGDHVATPPISPQAVSRRLRLYSTIAQPNHVETVVAEVDVDGAPHVVKFSRYHDNPQFWTTPGERDERLRGRRTHVVTEPEPDEYELYDLTTDPFEERNLAHPAHADDRTRALQAHMLGVLHAELERKRLTPAGGGAPGYRPPAEAPA